MAGKKDKEKIIDTKDGTFTVSVKSLGISKSETPHTNIEDPFEKMYASDMVLKPIYDPISLCKIAEDSQILGQCIEAMETNIAAFGWELERAKWTDDMNELPKEAIEEKHKAESIFNYCNYKQDLTQLRREIVKDQETIGAAYMEVVRNRIGEIAEFHRLPAHSVRKTRKDDEFTDFEQSIRDNNGKFIQFSRRVRFRRYVQMINGKDKVYFKEFGDPRPISKYNGKIISASNQNQAHEIIEFSLGSTYSAYSPPRWIGLLIQILGAKKADEVNYLFFDNKTIPPLVITVSGGNLTNETVKKLTDVFEKEIKGVQNFHKALILEATPASGSLIEGEKVLPVKIEVKPLTEHIKDDSMFTNYLDKNISNVRSAFRLPPIYTGHSDDYTRATAKEAARVAEEQVFRPERNRFDYIFNRTIMAEMQCNYWTFKSLGAKTTDAADMLESISKVKEAISIGDIREIVAELRNVPKGDIPDELYDIPLGLMNALLGSVVEPQGNENKPENNITEKTIISLVKVRERLEKALEARKAAI